MGAYRKHYVRVIGLPAAGRQALLERSVALGKSVDGTGTSPQKRMVDTALEYRNEHV